MEYWCLFIIGIIVTIITRIVVEKIVDFGYADDEKGFNKFIIFLLLGISIVLAPAIFVAEVVGHFANYNFAWWVYALIAIFPAVFVYLLHTIIAGMEMLFKKRTIYILFIACYIIAIVAWTIPICSYNLNFEKITETEVTSHEKRQLLYFCNIPVQNISGSISGSTFLGTGGTSGSISTSDELPFWYLNNENKAKYDSVLANTSTIDFISDEEKPYVETYCYRTYTTTINHNNGIETTKTDKKWEENFFYLPKSVMQYPLN